MIVLEKDIEAQLKRRVEYFGGKCIKFYSASETGLPDRIIILPGGKVAFVELKRPKGGKLAPMQKYQIGKLKDLGIEARVVKTYNEIEELLSEMQGLDTPYCSEEEYNTVREKRK